MSFFAGCDFFMVLFILLIPAVLLGLSEKKLKWYRWLLSLFFIWEVYGSTKIQLLYLIGYVIFAAYLVKIYLYLRKKYGRNKYIYGHAVFLSLLPLLVYKIGGLRGYSVFGFLGISYICFKIIQVVIECYDGVINEIDEFQFIEFLIFFPCLSSGPIDRSRRFAEDDNKIWSRQEYIELLWTGLYKIILGIFYKVACSDFFYYLLQTYFAGKHRPIYLVGYAYIYGLYLFFDFAGYSAMAVGTSYLLGIKTPDNFNKPFLSVDIKDFWNRWHITLSSWFRDFIFTRFMVDSARKKRFSNRLTGASVGLILNMLIMGVWHGLEGHYILYGLYHGILLAVVEVYQKKSKFYKKYRNNKCYVVCSWFINLNIVMLGFLIFSGYLTEVWNLILTRF